MINRRKFTNTIVSLLGVTGLLSVTHAFAATRRVKNDVARTFVINHRYMNFPVRTGANSQRLKLLVDGEVEREFDIELVDTNPQWWAFMDVGQLQGKSVTLQIDKPADGFQGLASILQSNKLVGAETLYREKRRPQFHFSSRRGWLNDPNGLVYYQGEYHLFYQHSPYNLDSAEKYWGHAVSKDLVHWQELPTALYPDQHGAIWSGSAVIDWHNTAGFEKGDEKTMVAMFTASGQAFTQCLAFSNDRGRRWEKYSNNPVLPTLNNSDRDPKVIWYAPDNKWVMVLYLDRVVARDLPNASYKDYLTVSEEKNTFGLFSSPDLKQWEKMSEVKIPGDRECAEFFEIAVDGNPENTHWIFSGANGYYLIGEFNGKAFEPISGPHRLQQGNCFYAAQTFNDIPATDGRRILMSWGENTSGLRLAEYFGRSESEEPIYQGMPFNQKMGLPVVLTLRQTEDGLRLYSNPVEELSALRDKSYTVKPQLIRMGDNPLATISGQLLDIEADFFPGQAEAINFNLRGIPVSYNVQKQELSCAEKTAPLKMEDGKIRLRMMVDRTSIDIFGNGGRLYMPMGMLVPEPNHTLAMTVTGGEAQLHSINVFELKSAWK